MKHRHEMHKKRGGSAHGKKTYAEESSEVEHEAGLKRGGKAKHHEHKAHGGKAHHRNVVEVIADFTDYLAQPDVAVVWVLAEQPGEGAQAITSSRTVTESVSR